jgi:dTDP-4-amino-4,6-dideoxygalactose transaminase
MRARYQYEIAGHNYRMTDVHAAIALPQMDRLVETVAERRRNAEALSQGLAGIEGLVVPAVMPGRTHVWHQFTVRITPDAPIGRDELSEQLTAAGVGNGVYYPRPVHDYDCYRGDPRVGSGRFPNAERAAAEVLSLPVHPNLTGGQLDRIIAAVRAALGA